MAKQIKFSIWECLLTLLVIMLIASPVYLKLRHGWNFVDRSEQSNSTVIRVATLKTDNLNLVKYQVEGVVYAATAPTPSSFLPSGDLVDSFRFDQSELQIVNDDDDDNLIPVAPLSHIEPVHAFNERILLVTGRRPVANDKQ